MIGWIQRMFSRRPPEAHAPAAPSITADDVEAAIERAGRRAVFDRANELGWTPSNPAPMWVWVAIAGEVIARQTGDGPTVH